ncbi:hypothetical protein COOONC_27330 [Cooperia oncophora]
MRRHVRSQQPVLFQNKFNTELGINTDLTWRNASSLNYAVNKIISTGVDGLLKVCNARRDYAGVLLSAYPFCVNRFYLLEQGGTDFNNAVTYVHLFKHLEFMCSTGFDVYQYNLPCILGVTAHDQTYNACYYKFQQTLQSYPNMLCQGFTDACPLPRRRLRKHMWAADWMGGMRNGASWLRLRLQWTHMLDFYQIRDTLYINKDPMKASSCSSTRFDHH